MDVQIDCVCPLGAEGKPHRTDTVTLRERLDFHQVTMIRQAMSIISGDDEAIRLAERLAVCVEFYLLLGIESWSLIDERGKPVVVSHSAIRSRLLEAVDVEPITSAAEELYNRVVLFPLVARASSSSPPTPTERSISPRKATGGTRQKPSKPSSTTTTRTDGIGTITTLPGGASNSSQSSTSAA